MTYAPSRPLIVGVAGASGSIIARELVDALLELERPVVVVASNAARMVWQEELDESYNAAVARWTEHPHFSAYAISDLFAPIASGTFPTAGMIIAPASMNTVASLAHGLTPNLLLRAADVTLKERRPLTLIPPGNSAARHPPGEPADPVATGSHHPAARTAVLSETAGHRRVGSLRGPAGVGRLGRDRGPAGRHAVPRSRALEHQSRHGQDRLLRCREPGRLHRGFFRRGGLAARRRVRRLWLSRVL